MIENTVKSILLLSLHSTVPCVPTASKLNGTLHTQSLIANFALLLFATEFL